MSNSPATRTTETLDGVEVHTDVLNGHVGYGFRINERSYTGTVSSVGRVRAAARRHIARVRADLERGRTLNDTNMRAMRTIRS